MTHRQRLLDPRVIMTGGGPLTVGTCLCGRAATRGNKTGVRCRWDGIQYDKDGYRVIPTAKAHDAGCICVGCSAVRDRQAALDQLALRERQRAALDLIKTIAAMTQDGEEVDGEEFIMENDDAVSTLNRLISDARDIVKAAR